jgi:hypothetical protein
MNNDEQKFDHFIDSLRFDDEPSAAHREKLERKLMQAYDNRLETEDYVEPVALYFRKLAIAASFLIGAGVLFWVIDASFIRQDPFARHPQKETIRAIIEEEAVTGTEKKQLVAQIGDVWSLISERNQDGLVAVLNASDIAYTVRTWAASCLAKFGDAETLAVIETKIHELNISDPNNPLIIAAEKIRNRLDAAKPDSSPADQLPGMQSLDSDNGDIQH